MSEKIKAIRGNKLRTEEVKQWLESQGAKDFNGYYFKDENSLYFVIDGKVDMFKDNSSYANLLDVVNIKPTLKVIVGNEENGNAVIKTLELMGGVNSQKLNGCDSDSYYFISNTGVINSESIESMWFWDYNLCKIDTQDIYKAKFEPFERVLCRYDNDTPWRPGIYSHSIIKDKKELHMVLGFGYTQHCIKYDSGKHLNGSFLTYYCDKDEE